MDDKDLMEKAVASAFERLRPVRERDWKIEAARIRAEHDERKECAKLVEKLGKIGLTHRQIAAVIRTR